ncbi:hypothetical protein RNM28_02780 [Mesomycoplasma ovipneumoniae]|uniref:hypothetical protein n=1 Tax=Mesomycoplasma ovipneumoniae TaxID=29562 RepID=UPI0028A96923|nr:hypothetical protein [Mesomycoplasma ovipneumoniae]WNM17067.1 hypothetical protein RNM28_02780 [Mesomycoplasma ovipneumoniae]
MPNSTSNWAVFLVRFVSWIFVTLAVFGIVSNWLFSCESSSLSLKGIKTAVVLVSANWARERRTRAFVWTGAVAGEVAVPSSSSEFLSIS